MRKSTSLIVVAVFLCVLLEFDSVESLPQIRFPRPGRDRFNSGRFRSPSSGNRNNGRFRQRPRFPILSQLVNGVTPSGSRPPTSNSQAAANVAQVTGPNGNQATQVSADVLSQQSGGAFGVSGGLALASNLQFNSPFGSLQLNNANANSFDNIIGNNNNNGFQQLGGLFRRQQRP